MYRVKRNQGTSLKVNGSKEGETIEKKVERLLNNNESMEEGKEIIYTKRSEGVLPSSNIRADRFDIALDAMDKVHATNIAKRMQGIAEREGAGDGKPESIGGTGQQDVTN